MIWLIFATGIFNTVMALLSKTQNVQSSFLFKVIPFFLGLGCLYYSLTELKLI